MFQFHHLLPGLSAAENVMMPMIAREGRTCLLYTSDAADERSSVDLGGRRIIKKKKIRNTAVQVEHQYKQNDESRKKAD